MWPKWQSRKTLNSPPPTSTPKLYLLTEQLSIPAIKYSVSTEG